MIGGGVTAQRGRVGEYYFTFSVEQGGGEAPLDHPWVTVIAKRNEVPPFLSSTLYVHPLPTSCTYTATADEARGCEGEKEEAGEVNVADAQQLNAHYLEAWFWLTLVVVVDR